MTPPAESGDALDRAVMTERLTTEFADRIAVYRDLLRCLVVTGEPSPPDPAAVETRPVEGPSLTTAHLRIHVRHSYQDADELGSFPPGMEPVCLRIHVQGYCDRYPDRRAAGSDLVHAVPATEAEAWARALLGRQWSDYAYEVIRRTDVDHRMRTNMMYTQPLFVVFLTSDGTPVLAPDNIAWHRVWPKVVDARKLEPDPSSNALRAHIARFGPYAPTEGIRHPDTEPDGGWRLELTGLSLDELTDTAAATVRALRDGIRVRGAIDKQFRPVRLHVEHDRVVVHFRWARNPNIFALAMRPPQTGNDLAGPPWHTPAAVAATVISGWQEELCTGLLVRGTRRREGRTIHISGPRTPTGRQEYWVGTVPLHERSGAWLARAGLDIDRPLEWKNAGVLAAWVQAFVNNRQARPFVGHAAAYWSDETTAHLEVLDTVPGTPDTVTAQLVHRLTHMLADLGAETITTSFENEHLADLGYMNHPEESGMILDVTTMP
ncbi:hypothetical protein [Rhodococcus aetherivorans]|uniref:hypothetical protein n=1 Tax=Rhodococcus aetherivorans TaxID=191292 RepID=UPI00294989B4|nr:hypothetical protein [Rhodococcus aetherivorans]MDV6296553.1 hypothetical protein [Rhodococcus aetherivorans]